MKTLALYGSSDTLVAGSLVSQYMILRDSVQLAARSGWGRRNALGTSAVVSPALLPAAVVAAGAW
jgi:hypothetical protein